MYSKTSTSHTAAAGALISFPIVQLLQQTIISPLPRISKTLPNHWSGVLKAGWATQDCHPSSTDVPVQAPNWPAGAHLLTPLLLLLPFIRCVFSRPLHLVLPLYRDRCFASSFLVGCHVRHTPPPPKPALDIGQSQLQISRIFKFLPQKLLSQGYCD